LKTIKLLAIQITQATEVDGVNYWELIKMAATTADEVDKKDLQPYLNELLHALLSDKAQCWIRIRNDRKITAVLITRITTDKTTLGKSLRLQCVYSFSKVSLDVWRKDFGLMVQFAKKEDCKNIIFDSRHSAIWEMVKTFGCREAYRSFVYDIGGI